MSVSPCRNLCVDCSVHSYLPHEEFLRRKDPSVVFLSFWFLPGNENLSTLLEEHLKISKIVKIDAITVSPAADRQIFITWPVSRVEKPAVEGCVVEQNCLNHCSSSGMRSYNALSLFSAAKRGKCLLWLGSVGEQALIGLKIVWRSQTPQSRTPVCWQFAWHKQGGILKCKQAIYRYCSCKGCPLTPVALLK